MCPEVAPDQTSVLLQARVAALTAHIDAAEASTQSIGSGLRERVEARLATEFNLHRIEVRQLSLEVAGGVSPAQLWPRLYRLQAELDDVFEEALDLVEGAALRASGLDDGYCRLADALLDEITQRTPVKWESFTVLGASEYYVRLSRVIRVRFPSKSFWELPIVAHEHGHFVGPALTVYKGGRTVHPLEELLSQARDRDAQYWSWFHEVFADVFAAYVVGPAYGLACAIERFDPVAARLETLTHPAPNTRMAVIDATLSALNEDRLYDRALAAMREAWGAGTSEAGTVADAELAEPFVGWLRESLDLLFAHLPYARYDDDSWAQALGLVGRLGDGTGVKSAIDARWLIRDLVNAAWLARIGAANENVRRGIAQRARTLAEQSVSEVL